ncbi:YfbM family protein [Kitasatospora sp. RB6PN24]|uniref:DUF1877 family protein n=1 Tax=Kitasatospora humi TaxID=2893891 RepID=UPI001E5A74CD|nr:DUF1877 family protein [Kitasatospora humi]MCC9312436.1 YfbM family protein [Kitasatospora humi]
MSMNGEYLRVTLGELTQALKDPEWALDLADGIQDSQEDGTAPSEARHFTTHQTWNLLDFLLKRSAFPVDIVYGEEPFAEADDWGYGPPRYLSARVRLATARLNLMTYDELIHGVDHTELVAAGIYPQICEAAVGGVGGLSGLVGGAGFLGRRRSVTSIWTPEPSCSCRS